MEWLSVVLEEYKTLRNESLASMQTQQSILRFGIAALAVLCATGFQLWEESFVADALFLALIPAMSYLVLIIWMGEVARMMRAGMRLMELEDRINSEFQDKPKALTWERWLRESQHDGKTPQLRWNYRAIILLFFLISILSIWFGNIKISEAMCLSRIVIVDIIELLCFGAVFLFVYRIGKRFV